MSIIKIFTNYDDSEAKEYFKQCYGYTGNLTEMFKSLDTQGQRVFLAREDAFIEGLKFKDTKIKEIETPQAALIDKLIEGLEYYKSTHPDELIVVDEMTLCESPLTVTKGKKAREILNSEMVRGYLKEKEDTQS